jgi:capsular polysaccharide biosynthesis protein
MSLKDISMFNNTDSDIIKFKDKDYNFFFIYNTENYYHFVYDTLPYLITYKKLKVKIPKLKLLMNYPNSKKTEFYKFVTEYLKLCGIKKSDIKIANKNTIYNNIIASTSYTHDFNSNLPPRKEVYSFYKQLTKNIKHKTKMPKKIYVSRRSSLHGDTSNIGTNYTTRRKMVNENELVNMLVQQGFTEVFTELMTTKDKIQMFSNAEHVVGAIGGGLCNVVFSNKKCKLTKSCIRELEKQRSWGGSHFYITGNNNLLLAKMHLGGSISKIERIIKA